MSKSLTLTVETKPSKTKTEKHTGQKQVQLINWHKAVLRIKDLMQSRTRIEVNYDPSVTTIHNLIYVHKHLGAKKEVLPEYFNKQWTPNVCYNLRTYPMCLKKIAKDNGDNKLSEAAKIHKYGHWIFCTAVMPEKYLEKSGEIQIYVKFNLDFDKHYLKNENFGKEIISRLIDDVFDPEKRFLFNRSDLRVQSCHKGSIIALIALGGSVLLTAGIKAAKLIMEKCIEHYRNKKSAKNKIKSIRLFNYKNTKMKRPQNHMNGGNNSKKESTTYNRKENRISISFSSARVQTESLQNYDEANVNDRCRSEPWKRIQNLKPKQIISFENRACEIIECGVIHSEDKDYISKFLIRYLDNNATEQIRVDEDIINKIQFLTPLEEAKAKLNSDKFQVTQDIDRILIEIGDL